MARRALEIGAAVETWKATGGAVSMHTFTMRHRRGQALSLLWDALSGAWGKVTSGKAWVTDRARFGVAGWLRVVEVTHGRNGWHVHVHSLVFREAAPPGGVRTGGGLVEMKRLHRSMFGRWRRALERAGLERPLLAGQDAREVSGGGDLGDYLAKSVYRASSVGVELTHSQGKRARSSNATRPVWSLLSEVAEDGLADSLSLWHEWERASKGRRQLTWSKGLRDLLALGQEVDDQAIAEEEIGTAADDLVWITPDGWRVVVARLQMAPLLNAAESGGLSAVRSLLDRIGAGYVTVGEGGV